MRENRPSGLEGGVAGNGHPYPYNIGKMHPRRNALGIGGGIVARTL